PCTQNWLRTNGRRRSPSFTTPLGKSACSLSARSILPVFSHAGSHATAMLAFWTHRFQSVQAHHREKLKWVLVRQFLHFIGNSSSWEPSKASTASSNWVLKACGARIDDFYYACLKRSVAQSLPVTSSTSILIRAERASPPRAICTRS